MVRGLRDDTTCLVIDIMPPENSTQVPYPLPVKKKNKFKTWLFGWRSKGSAVVANKPGAPGSVQELFEEGSAMLAERLLSLLMLISYFIEKKVCFENYLHMLDQANHMLILTAP